MIMWVQQTVDMLLSKADVTRALESSLFTWWSFFAKYTDR